jgi:hypothetical protein
MLRQNGLDSGGNKLEVEKRLFDHLTQKENKNPGHFLHCASWSLLLMFRIDQKFDLES